MKVMSFNLRADNIFDIGNRWEKRAGLIYRTIQDQQCDIVGLQEVTPRMYEDLNRNLRGYDTIGEGRTKRYFTEKNNLLVNDHHMILEEETFWLSRTPDKVGSTLWYSLFPRICTTAIVRLADGIKIRVYNTHLDCILPQAREYGIRTIIGAVERHHEKEQLPCILMGDFNATPQSKLIREFTTGKLSTKRFVAVQDSQRELYGQTTMSAFRGKEKGMHIDYIFVTEEFAIEDVTIVKYNENGKYPSDHYPLVARLNLSR
ncbi:MAG: endonuclease/exonuclease/phosphatase family protein [Cellulosilyticaceae bacterium]